VVAYLFHNGDLHLKNLSILEDAAGRWGLSPAYDLVNTSFYERDRWNSTLSVGGEKRNIFPEIVAHLRGILRAHSGEKRRDAGRDPGPERGGQEPDSSLFLAAGVAGCRGSSARKALSLAPVVLREARRPETWAAWMM
jgi:hypothetical protein